VGTVED